MSHATRILLAVCLLLPLAVGGCLKTQITIEMSDDGSATITERIWLSAALIELDRQNPGTLKGEQALTREAALERMASMGKGVTLVSHKPTDFADGARQSVAVFHIPDVEELVIANPFPDAGAPRQLLRLGFRPIYKFVHSYHVVGSLEMDFRPVNPPPRAPRPDPDAPPPPEPTPLQLQILRALQPVFIDMLNGFELEIKLVATRPIVSGHVRGLRAGTKTITLMSFTDKDLDMYGQRFIENEELMLRLLRLDFNADIVGQHIEGFAANTTLPILRGRTPYASRRLLIWPTKALFKKYFAGRPKSQGGDQPG